MARVTAAEVQQIYFEGEIPQNMLNFIEAAHSLVNDEFSTADGLSEGLLKNIELYIAAHFITVSQRQLTSQSLGNASFNYNKPEGLYLNSSSYGQTACIFDKTGRLSSKGHSKAAFILL